LWSVGAYLLSGAICTLAALAINKEWARPTQSEAQASPQG
jgi:hypothetical protein